MNLSVLLVEDPKHPCKFCGNECQFNCQSCEICDSWFHDDCNNLPKELLQNFDKIKGLLRKSEGCLDLKIKNDKVKQLFEKITYEIQNANLVIQND